MPLTISVPTLVLTAQASLCRGFMCNYCMQFLCNNRTIILDVHVGMPGIIAACCMQQLQMKPHLK